MKKIVTGLVISFAGLMSINTSASVTAQIDLNNPYLTEIKKIKGMTHATIYEGPGNRGFAAIGELPDDEDVTLEAVAGDFYRITFFDGKEEVNKTGYLPKVFISASSYGLPSEGYLPSYNEDDLVEEVLDDKYEEVYRPECGFANLSYSDVTNEYIASFDSDKFIIGGQANLIKSSPILINEKLKIEIKSWRSDSGVSRIFLHYIPVGDIAYTGDPLTIVRNAGSVSTGYVFHPGAKTLIANPSSSEFVWFLEKNGAQYQARVNGDLISNSSNVVRNFFIEDDSVSISFNKSSSSFELEGFTVKTIAGVWLPEYEHGYKSLREVAAGLGLELGALMEMNFSDDLTFRNQAYCKAAKNFDALIYKGFNASSLVKDNLSFVDGISSNYEIKDSIKDVIDAYSLKSRDLGMKVYASHLLWNNTVPNRMQPLTITSQTAYCQGMTEGWGYFKFTYRNLLCRVEIVRGGLLDFVTKHVTSFFDYISGVSIDSDAEVVNVGYVTLLNEHAKALAGYPGVWEHQVSPDLKFYYDQTVEKCDVSSGEVRNCSNYNSVRASFLAYDFYDPESQCSPTDQAIFQLQGSQYEFAKAEAYYRCMTDDLQINNVLNGSAFFAYKAANDSLNAAGKRHDIKLVFNDAGNHKINATSLEQYRVVAALMAAGQKIDAVGMQMHLNGLVGIDKNEFKFVIDAFSSLGVEIYLTELDVDMSQFVDYDRRQRQAEIFLDVFDVCLSSPACSMVSFWAINESLTTYCDKANDCADPVQQELYSAALFNGKNIATPAYFAIKDFLNDQLVPPQSIRPLGDIDNDGIADQSDNCKFVANDDQLNQDSDTYGDLCDADIDADGIPNYLDNCEFVANVTQMDVDDDGIGDACDTN